MMKKQKLWSLLLVSALVFSCTACAKKTEEAPEAASSTQTATTQAADTKAVEEKAMEETESPAWKPDDEVTFIVPYKAGGGSDLLARIWTNQGAKYFSTAFAVKNVEGGSQSIGLTELIQSKPDGLTIGVANASVCTNPLTSETPYVYTDELTALCKIAIQPYVVYVRADSEITSLKDLEKAVTSREVTQASNRTGGATHWELEYFAYNAGSDITSVIYSGGADAIAALMGGHVDVTVQSPADGKEYIRSGDLRAIAVLSDTRITSEVFKDVPTSTEQGYEWLQNSSFAGYAAPKDLPQEMISYYETAFYNALQDKAVVEAIENLGFTVDYEDSATFTETWTKTIDQYKTVLEEIYDRLYEN